MLANNVRQSVKNSNQGDIPVEDDGVWTNTRCWEFSGDASITKTYTAIQPLYPDSNDFSMSIWFKIIHSAPYATWNHKFLVRRYMETPIFSALSTPFVGQVKMLYDSPALNLKLQINLTQSIYDNTTAWVIIPYEESINKWVNLTMTFDGSESSDAVKVYFNGVLKHSEGNGASDFSLYTDPILSYNVSFGQASSGSGALRISDYAEWDSVLDQSNVTAIYNEVIEGQPGIPIDLSQASTGYTNAGNLSVYYRFGDGLGDNPASHLEDETDSANSLGHADTDGDRDFDYSGHDGSGYIQEMDIL